MQLAKKTLKSALCHFANFKSHCDFKFIGIVIVVELSTLVIYFDELHRQKKLYSQVISQNRPNNVE